MGGWWIERSCGPQPIPFFTSSTIRSSPAGGNSFSAKAVGRMARKEGLRGLHFSRMNSLAAYCPEFTAATSFVRFHDVASGVTNGSKTLVGVSRLQSYIIMYMYRILS